MLRKGYQVSLVCTNESPFLTKTLSPQIQTYGLRLGDTIADWSNRPGPGRAILDYVQLTCHLLGIFKRCNPDLIHALGSRSAKSVLLAAVLRGIPLSWSSGNLHRTGFLDRLLLRYSSCIVCASSAVREQYRRCTDDWCKIHLLYNSVDTALFASADPTKLRRDLGLRDEDVLLGTVGRVSPPKAQLDFVEAVIPLMRVYDDLQAVIVGSAFLQDESYLALIMRAIESSGFTSRFHVTGWRDDIPEIMRALDIFVLPSTTEGFGSVLIEAMAAGRPVVASAIDAIPEIVMHGHTGLHVQPGDRTSLTQAIERMILHPEERERFGTLGQERARELFDDRAILDAFAGIVDGAMSARDQR